MIHDAHGWWIAEAGAPAPLPALAEDLDADVVVVGGGYTGMWTAWEIAEREPNARVVVLEAERCGTGPSGRNGGFLSSLWLSFPLLRERVRRAARARAVRGLGGVGRHGRRVVRGPGGRRVAPRGAAPGRLLRARAGRRERRGRQRRRGRRRSPPAETRAICDSPVFRGGVATRSGATVQPARLAFGLRERLLGRGVRIFEGSRVRALHADRAPSGVVAETAGGRVRAGAAAVAVNAASGQVRRLRNRLTVSSSHIVLTEPVPDVIEALGLDRRRGDHRRPRAAALLPHHPRRAHPARLGRRADGGGRAHARARAGRRRRSSRQTRAGLLRIFPMLEGRRIEHAWGGPIDVSPTHLPAIVTLAGGRAWAAFGYTGNGVGPSHLAGRSLAALTLGRSRGRRALGLDRPAAEGASRPSRCGSRARRCIRAALARKEAAEEAGGRADPVSRGARGRAVDAGTAHRALICR